MADDVEAKAPPDISDSSSAMDEENSGIKFLDLPADVIRAVLILPILSMRDVSRVAQTCHQLNALVSEDSNDVWRSLHKRRWGLAHNVFLESLSSSSSSGMDWRAECQRAEQLVAYTLNVLEEIWPKIYRESEVCYSHFTPFRKIMEEDSRSYYYFKQFLSDLLNDGNQGKNLTQKYQVVPLLRYICQEHLTPLWKAFKVLPPEEQLLEVGVAYVSQWFQPLSFLPAECFAKQLDCLATRVLDHLIESQPEHPIFASPEEDRLNWRNRNLPCDQWSGKHCMQILRAVDYVLIKELGFHGVTENYHQMDNYFLNAVLQEHQGVPITLNTVVESIARRLGVRTELWYKRRFVLFWKSDLNPDLEGVYLNAHKGGSLIQPESENTDNRNLNEFGCPYQILHCPEGPATCLEVIERMIAGIDVIGKMSLRSHGHSTSFRSALELMFTINPKNLSNILHLARLYMLYNISVSDLINSMMETVDELSGDARKHAENILYMVKNYLSDSESKPLAVAKTRTNAAGVKFAVGMTMFHKQFNYMCVIVGWDPICTAAESWKQDMGVQLLQYKDNQPFYHVLVPDGTTRYAAQENLLPLTARDRFNVFNLHPDIGRYFESYQNGFYIPNSLKQAEYPEDLAVSQKFYNYK